MVRAPVDTRGLPAILLAFVSHTWGYSSAGRAPAWHAGGRGFDAPYLHHSSPYLSVASSGTVYEPRHLARIFRESPVDNYVWRRDRANRGSRKRSQTACLVLAGASDSVMGLWHYGVMELCHYIALTP